MFLLNILEGVLAYALLKLDLWRKRKWYLMETLMIKAEESN